MAVAIGSHNWTENALTDTHELSVLLRSAPVAADFGARFDELWDELP